jgi:hypothetical protein
VFPRGEEEMTPAKRASIPERREHLVGAHADPRRSA